MKTQIGEIVAGYKAGKLSLVDVTKKLQKLKNLPLKYYLSEGQKGLWTLQKTFPEMTAYNVPLCFRVLDLNVETFKRACQFLIEQYPIFNSTINEEKGDLFHIILPSRDLFIQQEDLSGCSSHQILPYLQQKSKKVFNLEKGPLLRIDLFSLSNQEIIVLITVHHIIFDGKSASILMKVLFDVYQAFLHDQTPRLGSLPATFSEYVKKEQELLQSKEGESRLLYWKQQLSGVLPQLNLTTDKPRITLQNCYRGKTCSYELSTELTQQLKTFSNNQGSYLSTVLLAFFKILLFKYTNQKDIIVGMPFSERGQERFDKTIGFLVNMVPIRSKIEPEASVISVINKLQKTIIDGLAHSYPFPALVRRLNLSAMAGNAPVFQASFMFQDFIEELDVYDLPVQFIEGMHQEGEYEVVLEVIEQKNHITLNWKYNSDLFSDETIARLAEHYAMLVRKVIVQPDMVLDNVSLLSEDEQKTLLVEWNDTQMDYLKDQCVHELIAEQARKTPQAIAIMYQEQTVTYEQLDKKSSQLAAYLQDHGIRPNALVAIYVERSIDMLIGLLAILKAGGAYVPLDPKFPTERLSYILNNSQANIILTQSKFKEKVFALGNPLDREEPLDSKPSVIAMDEQWPQIDKTVAEQNHQRQGVRSCDLAYVIYTSGSTGHPKGVMISHQALMNFLMSMAHQPGLKKEDTLLAVTTYCFDIAGLELYLPLMKGATCCICDDETTKDAERLKNLIGRVGPTIMQATPSTWTMLFHSGWKNEEKIKILCGGEALPESLKKQFIRTHSDAWNLFGPTETTIWSTIEHIEEDQPVTIGKPIANTQIYVLDEQKRLSPIGIPGELCIAGDGLAKGYYKKTKLTSEKFVDNPFNRGHKLYRTGDLARWLPNGKIEYLGRMDFQVKIRGFRIELGEIENHINSHSNVKESIVVVKERADSKQLIAYYVPIQKDKNKGKDLAEELKAFLKTKLPDYMVPAHLFPLDQMPLTPNRKIDRNALIHRKITLIKSVQNSLPSSERENEIIEIWKAVLDIEDINPTDGFFEAGGDSLSAVILAERISQNYHVSFRVTQLFQHSSVRKINQYLNKMNDVTPPVEVRKSIPESQSNPVLNGFNLKDFQSNYPEYYKDSLAIIGISCRFPGAKNIREFWQNLKEGKESARFFSKEELRQFKVPEEMIQNPDYVPMQLTIEGKDLFDPAFFNLSPKNTALMDPQFRLLLMHSWQAIEDAGYISKEIPETSVFMSVSNNYYQTLLNNSGTVRQTDQYPAWIFAQGGTIPTMISYELGLRGPSLFVHSNCSSSLAALSLAFQSLRLNESRYALVGASSLMSMSTIGYVYKPGQNFSSDGHCKAFDASADGMTGGEGVGVVVVKKALDAIQDGDHIYALLRGIGFNNDGSDKAGYYAPSVNGQSELIQKVLSSAGIHPESIQYVEAHGTGTQLGDPIEVQAITEAYQKRTSKTQFCALGSVKSNIGHLDTVAGLAGCIKVALSLKHKTIPPSVNYTKPNPEIDFEHSPFYVIDHLQKWSATSLPRRAALSSFGIGGTNVHAILEEYEAVNVLKSEKSNSAPDRETFLIPLSAKNENRLVDYSNSLLSFLKSPREHDLSLRDLSYTLQVGREAMERRVIFIVQSIDQLIEMVQNFNAKRGTFKNCLQGNTKKTNEITRLFDHDEELQESILKWIASGKLKKLGEWWVNGGNVDWKLLYPHSQPYRISLPSYPFAQERYWIEEKTTKNDPDLIQTREESFQLPEVKKKLDQGCLANDHQSKPTEKPSAYSSGSSPKPKRITLTALAGDQNKFTPEDNKQPENETADREKTSLDSVSNNLTQSTPYPEERMTLETLQKELILSLAEELFIKPNEIELDRSFSELGLDSIAGIEWIQKLNQKYGLSMAKTNVYDYPNIQELAQFLEKEIVKSGKNAIIDPLQPESPAITTQPKLLINFKPNNDTRYHKLYFYSNDLTGDYEQDGEISIRYVFNPNNNICLKDHLVFGVCVFPTDAYLELVYVALRSYFEVESVVLKNVSFANPIIGQDRKNNYVRVVFQKNDSDSLRFTIRSSETDRPIDEQIHVSGLIYRAERNHEYVSKYSSDIKQTLKKEFDLKEEPSDQFKNIEIGEFYSSLKKLLFGKDNALGYIQLTEADQRFLLHPSVLNGGLGTAMIYGLDLLAKQNVVGGDTYLPYKINNLQIKGSLNQDAYYCYAELIKIEKDWIELYFELIDKEDNAVLIIETIRLQRVSQNAVHERIKNDEPALMDTQPPVASFASKKAKDIAIIGMSCRFPGCKDIDEYWNSLKNGRDCITEVPKSRWTEFKDWYHSDPEHKNTTYTKRGGFLEDVDQFDASFFNIAPIEAEIMDPQQRIFLEESWKAIESAGYSPFSITNNTCGIYVGCTTSDYSQILAKSQYKNHAHSFTGTSSAILAARISYFLNLNGPALAIDTSCSSSLTAIHLACETIRNRDVDLAIAGGVSLMLSPTGFILTSQIGMQSKMEKCATFDQSADGTVFSEGCGVLVLKSLDEAKRDRDPIQGVIKGSGYNQDGKTNGITAPSALSQEKLLTGIYKKFDIDPNRISYVEAHGTATPLGDPVEIRALTNAFRGFTEKKQFCAIGSVKSNIGHMSFAAGVGGVIKVLLCLKHQEYVPSLHYTEPSEHIQFEQTPFFVNTENRPWPTPYAERRVAAISSFGFSGTNVHMVVEEYETVKNQASTVQTPDVATKPAIIPLSARTRKSLKQYAQNLLCFIKEDWGIDSPNHPAPQPTRKYLEDKIRGILSEMPMIDGNNIVANERFLSSGVELIHQIELMEKLQNEFETEINSKEFLEQNSIALIVEYLLEKHDVAPKVIVHREPEDHQSEAGKINLTDLAYTLQVGREAMEERLGVLAQSMKDLEEKLQGFIDGKEDLPGLYVGQVNRNIDTLDAFTMDETLDRDITDWINKGQYSKLLDLWIKGLKFDWNRLYGKNKPQRIVAPTYPFMRERYWVKTEELQENGSVRPEIDNQIQLAIQENTPDLIEQRLTSTQLTEDLGLKEQTEENDLCSRQVQLVDKPQFTFSSLPDKTPKVELGSLSQAEDFLFQAENAQHHAEAHLTAKSLPQLSTKTNERLTPDIEHQLSKEILQKELGATLASVLHLNASQIDFEKQFTEMGMDSILAVEWIRLVNKKYSLNLKATKIYDYPTISEFAAYMKKESGMKEPPQDQKTLPHLTMKSDDWLTPDIEKPISKEILQTELAATLASALHLNASQIDFEKQFTEMGMDSILAVEWIRLVNKKYSLNLKATKIYDYPTISEFAAFMKKALEKKEKAYVEKILPRNTFSVQEQRKSQAVDLLKAPENQSAKIPLLKPDVLSNRQTHKLKPENLGNPIFQKRYGCKLNYFTGSMYRAIASEQFVVSMGKADLLSFFGSAGFRADELEPRIQTIQSQLGKNKPYGICLLSDIDHPQEEMRLVELFIKHRVPIIEVSAYSSLTPAIVYCRLKGISQNEGRLMFARHIIAKCSRLEVARLFLAPPPISMVNDLLASGMITEEEARLSQVIPMASDLAIEADSGGHTDQGISFSLIPSIVALKDSMMREHHYPEEILIGCGGGIGTPQAVVSAFALGADFIFTGSINQCTVESGAHDVIKNLLSTLSLHDTTTAPAGDMFEIGAKVQVMRKSTLFPQRANRLYQLFQQYHSIEEIPHSVRQEIEKDYFKKTFSEVWEQVCDYKNKKNPEDVKEAVENSRIKMKLIFQWYFSFATQVTLNGIESEKDNFQVYCGPAMGAFNQWVKGTELENWRNRHVDQISNLLMEKACEYMNKKSLFIPEVSKQQASSNDVDRQPIGQQIAPEKKVTLSDSDIAIIGMSGQFPGAKTLDEFWENIAQGKNCVSEVPARRWSIDKYYNPDLNSSGKTDCKWMGVLDGSDQFDPLFFNISPREAVLMDPQHRLILENAWHCVENAGITPSSLSGSSCGVFIGCGSNEYLDTDRILKSQGVMGSTAGLPSILPARVSYFLNLKGPCLAIDTACSSSLVSIVYACDSLINGSSELALAGGVLVITGPKMHVMNSEAGLLSKKGRCCAFDQKADGFVLGEGVGVLLLKRYSEAVLDGNRIHGVIKGWGVNQDGKTNGLTAPSMNSQISLEKEVYERFHINPGTISLVEAQGYGTMLGDPLEVEALTDSFRAYTEKKHCCALGSVKNNIGNTGYAGGVAGVIKVLLALKEKKIPPLANFETLNDQIDLEDSPFYINTELRSWETPPEMPRRASVNSFGYNGTNAHMVIEEYISDHRNEYDVLVTPSNPVLIILSARNQSRLNEYARNLLSFIQKKAGPSSKLNLTDIAYTLQVGREAMKVRLGFTVHTMDNLEDKLGSYIKGIEKDDIFVGHTLRPEKTMSDFTDEEEQQEAIRKWIDNREMSNLLNCWINGADVDWTKLYEDDKSRLIDLPTYPFERKRYWLDSQDSEEIDGTGLKNDMQGESSHDPIDVPGNLEGDSNLSAGPGEITGSEKDRRYPMKKNLTALSGTVLEDSADRLINKTRLILKHAIFKILNVKNEDMDPDAKFIDFGFDSVTFLELTDFLKRRHSLELDPTIFFQYSTIESCAKYIAEEYQNLAAKQISNRHEKQRITDFRDFKDAEDLTTSKQHQSVRDKPIIPEYHSIESDPIAIVGMSGKFPMAKDLNEFWENLSEEKDCIKEIPKDRWDWKKIYGDPRIEKNKTNNKWGGFIDGVGEFDPSFFGIPPQEARLMDPHQRLIMTYVWLAFEDAGYSASSLSGSNTGIFVGTTGSGYGSFFTTSDIGVEDYNATDALSSIGPNRMSYLLNLHGPSETIETACSSSLIAIHKAIIAMKAGDCDQAIAGGVNTILTPDVHISFDKSGMLSNDGRCKAFSKDANGYVRGEGVGMLFLKRLKAAEMTGDHIYGIIRGSAQNHNGRSSSLTAMNPKGQAELLQAVYARANIDPKTVNYIETHGTGTLLGDSIEIIGLKSAFNGVDREVGDNQIQNAHCGLGSVKTNIGHLELAAGMAGMIKVLLQLQHKRLVKSLYCDEINPLINLKKSPFYIVQESQDWQALKDPKGNVLPRRAGVSSFGFGGVNAHVILEEYIPKEKQLPEEKAAADLSATAVILLSARNSDRLKDYAKKLLRYIQKNNKINLANLAYTLQIGREAMEDRLGIIVDSLEDLEEKLRSFIENHKFIEGLYLGQVRRNKDILALFNADDDLLQAINAWMTKEKYSKLLDLWVKGLNLDWNRLYGDKKPQRISAPTYPFARELYWLETRTSQETSREKPGKNNMCQHSVQKKTSRVLDGETFMNSEANGMLMVKPVWVEKPLVCHPLDQNNKPARFNDHRVFLCGLNPKKQDLQSEAPHITFTDLEPKEQQTIDKKMAQRFINGSLELFESIRKILQEKPKGHVLLQVLVPAQGPQNVFSALSGLLKTAHLENPQLLGQVIAVKADESIEDIIAKLHESSHSPEDQKIRYEGEKRFVASFEELTRSASEQGILWKEGGVYLVTGGVEDLGLIFARKIVEKINDVKMIFTGRSELSKAKQARLKELERLGAKVEYKTADVSDQKAVADLIREIQNDFGDLNGIIHNAEAIRDNFSLKQSKEEFEQVLAPNVFGAMNIDQSTKELNLDFFVLFSSGVSATGSLGQVDYTVANAFMDEFAKYRNSLMGRERSGQTLSINWPLWNKGSMEADKATDQMMRESKELVAMEAFSGIEAFYQSLASSESQVKVIEEK